MSNATFVTCILYSKDAHFAKTHSEVKLHLLLAMRFAVEPQSEKLNWEHLANSIKDKFHPKTI